MRHTKIETGIPVLLDAHTHVIKDAGLLVDLHI